jgi:hypothetical protein
MLPNWSKLKRDEPGNKLVDVMLVMARTMHPGAQKANPYHHGAGDEQGGQFTTRDDSTLYFEAAPDPNDKELTQRWETLTAERKANRQQRAGQRCHPGGAQRAGRRRCT